MSGTDIPPPFTRDGPGYRADVDLPYGVTVADILERRDRLASGLRRNLGFDIRVSVDDAARGMS